MTIPGVSVMSVSSLSEEPIAAATPPVRASPTNIHMKTRCRKPDSGRATSTGCAAYSTAENLITLPVAFDADRQYACSHEQEASSPADDARSVWGSRPRVAGGDRHGEHADRGERVDRKRLLAGAVRSVGDGDELCVAGA